MSFVDLRPSAILRYKLAVMTSDAPLEDKRRLVGSSFYISAITLPIFIIIGLLLSYIFPILFNISAEYVGLSRLSVLIVALFLGLKSFLGVPDAVMRGLNLEFKGMFLEPMRNILYILLVIISLRLNYGLLGVLFASFVSFLLLFLFKIFYLKKYLIPYTPLKPKREDLKGFSLKGSWYLLSSFATQMFINLDVFLIGIFINPISVAMFTLTKNLSFRFSEALVNVAGSVGSSLSALIAERQIDKLAEIRYSFLRWNIIVGFALMLYFNLFNRYFIMLWVGSSNFAGQDVNFVINLTLPFILLSLSTQLFIDAYMDFRYKSRCTVVSTIIAFIAAILLQIKFGMLGIAIGIFVGRVVLSILYEMRVNQNIEIISLFKNNIKSSLIIMLFIFLTLIISLIDVSLPIVTWWDYLGYSLLFGLLLFLYLFFFVVTRKEKAIVLDKLRR